MLDDSKPQTEEEYVVWARENLHGDFNDTVKRQYNANQTVASQTVDNHPFFAELNNFLSDIAKEHSIKESFPLLMEPEGTTFRLKRKTYLSALNKVFRMNVLRNKNFPQPPKNGWVTPENWFSLMDDLLRGTIVCKYIDGPKLLGERLIEFAERHGLASSCMPRQLDRGYYAYHYYVKIPIEINDLSYAQVDVDMTVEIQLTTQLQEVMYQITHKHYTEERSKLEPDQDSWKWDVKSSRFKAGYLAHTLHLLEAIILELRDSPLEQPLTEPENINA